MAGMLCTLLLVGVFYIAVVDRRVETQGERAVSIARNVWGAQACNGSITLREASLPGNQSGEASWTETRLPTGVRRSDCVISVDNRDWSRARYCGVIVHEYGHLLGKGHSSNRRAIMYPVMTSRNIPSICKRPDGSSLK